ncbi:MAG TPA: phosphoadenylyl-sulfate reductase [Nitrospirota bacterium]|jgi:phosphoadenosine phosphosulfate reductase
MSEKLLNVPVLPENATALDILKAGVKAAGGRVAVACSFSIEDTIIIDIAKKNDLPIEVFAIDTGRLNEETYEVAEALTERYGKIINWYYPTTEEVEKLEREKGLYSFRKSLDNRHECCGIRKVVPLQRALKPLSAWITGLRKEQNVTRKDMPAIEIDGVNGGILKINPLINWTGKDVEEYAKENALPVNKLFYQGYPSIGCEPCTRAVQPGEHPRAGRWWWEDPEHKECGLHAR